jgi:hypothetical protein
MTLAELRQLIEQTVTVKQALGVIVLVFLAVWFLSDSK